MSDSHLNAESLGKLAFTILLADDFRMLPLWCKKVVCHHKYTQYLSLLDVSYLVSRSSAELSLHCGLVWLHHTCFHIPFLWSQHRVPLTCIVYSLFGILIIIFPAYMIMFSCFTNAVDIIFVWFLHCISNLKVYYLK